MEGIKLHKYTVYSLLSKGEIRVEAFDGLGGGGGIAKLPKFIFRHIFVQLVFLLNELAYLDAAIILIILMHVTF